MNESYKREVFKQLVLQYHYLYSVCTGKKNFSNNLSYGPDGKENSKFAAYDKN